MLLLSNSILGYLKKAFKFGQILQCHPYVWNDEKGSPEFVRSKAQLSLWILNVVTTFAYYIFVLVRCVQVQLDPTVARSKKIYMQFAAAYYIFPSLFQIAILLSMERMSDFVRQFLRLKDILEMDYGLDGSGSKLMLQIGGLLLGNVFYGFNVITLLVVSLSFLRPDSPEFLSSVLISDPKSMSLLGRIPFSLFQLYYECNYHGNAFLIIFVGLGATFIILAVLQNLRQWLQTSPIHFKHKPQDFVEVYKCLQIIIINLTPLYSSFVIPTAKIVLIMFSVFCTYGAIRLHGVMSLGFALIGVNTTSFLAGTLLFFAEVHQTSTQIMTTLRTLGVNRERSWRGKSVRSMRTLKITVASTYFIDKRHVLTMYKIVSDSVINFLIANRG